MSYLRCVQPASCGLQLLTVFICSSLTTWIMWCVVTAGGCASLLLSIEVLRLLVFFCFFFVLFFVVCVLSFVQDHMFYFVEKKKGTRVKKYRLVKLAAVWLFGWLACWLDCDATSILCPLSLSSLSRHWLLTLPAMLHDELSYRTPSTTMHYIDCCVCLYVC